MQYVKCDWNSLASFFNILYVCNASTPKMETVTCLSLLCAWSSLFSIPYSFQTIAFCSAGSHLYCTWIDFPFPYISDLQYGMTHIRAWKQHCVCTCVSALCAIVSVHCVQGLCMSFIFGEQPLQRKGNWLRTWGWNWLWRIFTPHSYSITSEYCDGYSTN